MRAERLKVRDRGHVPEVVVPANPAAMEESRRIAEQSAEPLRPIPPVRRPAEAKAAEESGASVGEMISAALLFVRRQWLILAAGFILGLLLVPLAVVAFPPVYKATATLMLDTSRVQIFPQQGMIGDTPFDNSAAVESQLEVMRSDRIARKVIQKLGLDKDPAFQVASETRTANLLGPTIAELLGKAPIRSPERIDHFRVEVLNSMIEVRRVSGTFAVEIIGQSDDGKRAADLANSVASAYISEHIERKQELSNRAIGWMGGRIEDLRDQLEAAQKAVFDYRNSNNIAGIDLDRATDGRISELEGQLNGARTSAREAQARLDRVNEAIAGYDKASIKPVLPDLMNNPVVTKLRENYIELANRLGEWNKRYGKSHEATVRLRVRIGEIHEAVLDEYRRLGESYRSEFEIANKRAAAIETELATAIAEKQRVDGVRLRLKELENVVQNHQRTLETISSRQTETNEQRSFPIARAWVLNDATEPVKKVLKRTLQAALVLFGLGVTLGLGAALLRDFADRSFRRISDARGQFPSASVEFVPVAPAPKQGPGTNSHSSTSVPTEIDRQRIVRSNALFWNVVEQPGSGFARSIRSIRHSLDRVNGKAGTHVLGFTAAAPGDGATTTAAAVALAAAWSNSRTLLIDCNLRDPSLTRQLAPQAKVGLLEVMEGYVEFEDALCTDPTTGLRFLPLVISPDVIPDEVMASNRLVELIGEWRTEHMYVIVDLPHLTQSVDVGLSRHFITSYVSVVNWGRTSIDSVREAMERHALDARRFSAVIMNRVRPEKLSKFDPGAYRWLAGR